LQRYTKRDKPWKLVYWEEFKNKKEALLREREIKSKKSRKFIENLIKKEKQRVIEKLEEFLGWSRQ